jgi:hypothetical protein
MKMTVLDLAVIPADFKLKIERPQVAPPGAAAAVCNLPVRTTSTSFTDESKSNFVDRIFCKSVQGVLVAAAKKCTRLQVRLKTTCTYRQRFAVCPALLMAIFLVEPTVRASC